MPDNKIYLAAGFMSGTSMDGVDAALIRTDGQNHIEHLGYVSIPYIDEVRDFIRDCLNPDLNNPMTQTKLDGLSEVITHAHVNAFYDLMQETKTDAKSVDLIGFHGHTVAHDPAKKMTLQVGDGELFARLTETDVIYDFRSADVAAGGQGAPLAPLYHKALSHDLPHPFIYLNIGGVANLTYIDDQDHIMAFDTGPGNALIDDWMSSKTVHNYDENGTTARTGTVDQGALKQLLSHAYFDEKPPKSLDRNDFSMDAVKGADIPDGAATLTAFTVSTIVNAVQNHLPQSPKYCVVSGGGRHNSLIMDSLNNKLNIPVKSIDEQGLNGDAIEAEAFAYLAVRSKKGLPISLPDTTGVATPLTGGVFCPAGKRNVKTG